MNEERLGNENILKLVVRMALPAMLTMAFQALYNAFDSLFIARYSSHAFASISITQPVINISLAISAGLGAGMAGCISRYLGQRNKKSAEDGFKTALLSALSIAILIALLSLLFSNSFVASFTSDALAIELGSSYLNIISICFPFVFLSTIIASLFNSHSLSLYAMLIQSSGAILNIILDPIFIFYFDLGANGAAIATALGYVFSFIFGLILYNRRSILSLKGAFSFDVLKSITNIALPSMMVSAAGSIVGLIYNRLILSYGLDEMAVYSMYLKLESFMFLASSGISSALVVIVAYNYGAKFFKRVKIAYFTSMLLSLAIMLLGFAFFQIFTKQLVMLFTADDKLLDMGLRAFKKLSYCFLLTSFNISTSGLLQGLGKGERSLILTMTRFFLLLIPLSIVLNYFFGLDGLYLSYFASDVLVLPLIVIIYKITIKECLKTKE